MRVDALIALVIHEIGVEDGTMKLLAAGCGGTRIKLGLVEDPYRISMALNGCSQVSASSEDTATSARLSAPLEEIIELCLERPENGTIQWSVSFTPE